MRLAAQAPPIGRRARAFIALGTNRAPRQWRLRRALAALDRIPHTRVVRCSRLYRNSAVGPGLQPEYLNAVAELCTALSPLDLFRAMETIEHCQQRRRTRVRASPRTIDLDLLLHGIRTIERGRLILPHPRMHQRDFVLWPLCDIVPSARIPGYGTVAELVNSVPASGRMLERAETMRFG